MERAVTQFWQEFLEKQDLQGAVLTDAFRFGSDADWLASLVLEGKKTATTSGRALYELENEPLPQEGQYYIVLNGQNAPVAVIQTKKVDILPMNEVTEEFALAEGEGDYNFWWQAHEKFFTESLKMYNLTFSADFEVVCETFEVLHTKPKQSFVGYPVSDTCVIIP